jgi:hypothetical protein
MPWKLTRWKPCDGGCCVRSPRFPRADNLGTVPGAHPAFMADCVYHLNEPGGTNPDGSTWRGGCALYRDLLQAVAERNAANNISRLRTTDVLSKPSLGPIIREEVAVSGRDFRLNVRQWFLDTCWIWPVPTTLIQAVITRLQGFGWYQNDPGFSAKLSTTTIYTDAEKAATEQEFHVTWAQVQDGSALTVPATCCWVWEPV